MNKALISKDSYETLIPIVDKYGKPAVALTLGLTGLSLIKEIAEKAIEEKVHLKVGFMGLSLELNN